jgi:ABC-2 type transport system permease protein
MNKFWRIAWQEYSRHVFRRRFLFALFSFPALLILMVGLILIVVSMQSSSTPIGYVDNSGILANPVPQPHVKWPDRITPMLAYADKASAQADLEAGKLQAYFIISADYLQTGKADEVYKNEPKGMSVQQFNAFLTSNLMASQPPDIANRIINGNKLIVQSADNSRGTTEDRIFNVILPIVAGILFIIAMSTTSGYLMQAVVEEKENRTMEIMVTSVSPNQLMTGKTLADIAVGFTQLLVWVLFVAIALVIGKNYIPQMSNVKFSGETIALLAAVMIPAFIMISGLMAAIGATVSEASEGQQLVGLFTIPLWLPFFFFSTLLENPNSPLAIILSFFPLTAPMTIALRIGLSSVPEWQLITSVIILVLSAIGAVWLAGRAFRMGMLRYGQRLRWKEVFSRQRV